MLALSCTPVATTLPFLTRVILARIWASLFPICTTSPSISISSPGNTGRRHVVLSVLVTPAISQNPSLLAVAKATVVHTSTNVLVAPPCKVPATLHIAGVTVRRVTARGLGVSDAETTFIALQSSWSKLRSWLAAASITSTEVLARSRAVDSDSAMAKCSGLSDWWGRGEDQDVSSFTSVEQRLFPLLCVGIDQSHEENDIHLKHVASLLNRYGSLFFRTPQKFPPFNPTPRANRRRTRLMRLEVLRDCTVT